MPELPISISKGALYTRTSPKGRYAMSNRLFLFVRYFFRFTKVYQHSVDIADLHEFKESDVTLVNPAQLSTQF